MRSVTCRDVGHVYWYEYDSDTWDHTPASGKWLITFSWHITGKCNINGDVPTLIRLIHDLKNMSWRVQINHTWRDGNISTNWLANFSLFLDTFDLHMIETPPKELQRLLFYDIFWHLHASKYLIKHIYKYVFILFIFNPFQEKVLFEHKFLNTSLRHTHKSIFI